MATARLVRGARVQVARAATGPWRTVSQRRAGGRTAYRVLVVNGSRLLSTGTVKARWLTPTVRRATTATNRRGVATLVRHRLSDLRGVRVVRAKT